jgi:hypothetical protein
VLRKNLAHSVAQVGSAAFCFGAIDLPGFYANGRVSPAILMLTVDEVGTV